MTKRPRNISEAERQRRRERIQRLWADPDFRRRHSEQKSALMQRMNADPAFQAKAAARSTISNKSPEKRAIISRKTRERLSDPANRERLAEAVRGRMADPAAREKATRAAAAASAAQWGVFWCPDDLKPLYVKLKAIIGHKAAREQIRKEIAARALKDVSFA